MYYRNFCFAKGNGEIIQWPIPAGHPPLKCLVVTAQTKFNKLRSADCTCAGVDLGAPVQTPTNIMHLNYRDTKQRSAVLVAYPELGDTHFIF